MFKFCPELGNFIIVVEVSAYKLITSRNPFVDNFFFSLNFGSSGLYYQNNWSYVNTQNGNFKTKITLKSLPSWVWYQKKAKGKWRLFPRRLACPKNQYHLDINHWLQLSAELIQHLHLLIWFFVKFPIYNYNDVSKYYQLNLLLTKHESFILFLQITSWLNF